MSTPLIDKTFEGMLRQMRRELTLVWRRLGTSGTTPHIQRGTALDRAATTSTYWDMWQDTDGAQLLYVGNKSGGWRQFSGNVISPTAAWATTQGTAPAAIIAGRTDTLTLDTVLEPNENLIVTATSVGSGFGTVSLNGVVKNPTNTQITVRLMQLGSTTTQQFSMAWHIVQYG